MTASYVTNAISSSLAATASYVVNALTASYVTNAISASQAASASYAQNADLLDGRDSTVFATTGSNIFSGSQGISGSISTTEDATIRNAYIGLISAFGSNYMSFSHIGRSGTNDYSLLSDNTGVTYLNAKSGSNLRFRIDNIDKVIIDSNGNLGINKTTPNAKLDVDGNSIITGSLDVTNGITGSLFGTASNSISASYSVTASYIANAQTASYVVNALSASLAATASTADNFTVRGTLTAQTLVVQTITSSIVYSSGSNRFGSQLTDTQAITGSTGVTGSLEVNGYNVVTANQTSSMSVASSSFALTASYAANVPVTSSYALTASYVENALTASYVVNALTASYVTNAISASQAANAYTASYVANAISSSYALTASFALNGGGGGGVGFPFSGSAVITGSLLVSGSGITGSFSGDGSGLTGIIAGGKVLTQSTASSTWTFNHLLNSQYPNVTVYNASNEVVMPQSITATDANTLTLTFGSPVAGYAVANIGSPTTVTGRTARQFFTTSNTWSFDHALGDKYVMVQAFDSNFEMVIPTSIILSTTASATILFDSASTGYALATIGGDLPTISSSYAGYVLTVGSASPYSASWSPITSVPTASYVLNAQSASYAVTASYVANAQTASYVVNALTASYVTNAISASQAANSYTASYVLNAQTASYAFTASYISGSGAGSGFPFSGSGVITGSLLVSGTFIVSGTVDFANANIDNSRYLHSQTSAANTWSVNHNLEYSYPNVTIYDTTGYVIQPDEIISVDNNTTSVLFTVAQAGYANVSVGGISTGQADRFLFTQASATGSWVINHGLNYKYVNVDIYDNNDQLMIPQVVTATDVNTLTVTFATATSGNAIISKGGARTTSLFVDRSNGNYSFSGSMNVTGSGIFSGDVDADNFNTTSDFRLKTNLEVIEGALDKIEALNGYTFDWIQEYSGDKTRQIGLVAQEVYSVQPELISYREFNQEEIMVLDYSKVTALLINAVKELSVKVKDLESKINK